MKTMANWKYKINVKDEFQAAQRGELTFRDVARVACKQLTALPVYQTDDELMDIVETLEAVAEDTEADADDFDYVWNDLYDWADQNVGYDTGSIWSSKMCWIGTF
jgi:hypothetical protein